MSAVTDKLTSLGFTEDPEATAYFQMLADQFGMDKGGPYEVETSFVREGCYIVIEKNTGDEDLGGLQATVRYPSVAIIESPKGRVAFNPDDLGLLERLIDELG